MNEKSIGDRLYNIVLRARGSMFDIGELTELTIGSFDIAAKSMATSEQEKITVTFPIGYHGEGRKMPMNRYYEKDVLLQKYAYLAGPQVTANAVIQLVTFVEAMLSELVRTLVLEYPGKIGGKRTMPLQNVLESKSIQEVHLRAVDSLLNELTYKSPTEFAEAISGILSFSLLDCPAFLHYVEIKATRDILVHNQGIANAIYQVKAGAHSRATAGIKLPMTGLYFLESYEQCLRIADWLEKQLNERWKSEELEARKNSPMPTTGIGNLLTQSDSSLL